MSKYWFIGEDTDNVWSLDDHALIGIADTDYVFWALQPDNKTQKIASTADLYDTIASSFPEQLAASAPALEEAGGLRPIQAFEYRMVAGVNITYTGQPTLDGHYAVDDPWLTRLMAGALVRCGATTLAMCSNPFPGGGSSYDYLDADLVPHTMSITQMQIIALAIDDYFAQLQAQLEVGLAEGTPIWPSADITVP
jgi:hypothetical protein